MRKTRKKRKYQCGGNISKLRNLMVKLLLGVYVHLCAPLHPDYRKKVLEKLTPTNVVSEINDYFRDTKSSFKKLPSDILGGEYINMLHNELLNSNTEDLTMALINFLYLNGSENEAEKFIDIIFPKFRDEFVMLYPNLRSDSDFDEEKEDV